VRVVKKKVRRVRWECGGDGAWSGESVYVESFDDNKDSRNEKDEVWRQEGRVVTKEGITRENQKKEKSTNQ
jgi:hypothetical protein